MVCIGFMPTPEYQSTPIKYNVRIEGPVLKVKTLTKFAIIPVKSSEMAAGFDLFSAYDYDIPAGGTKVIKTDISIELMEGSYGRRAPRSGLAVKGIGVGAGVIDRDYRGNLGVVLYNHSKDDYHIKSGDRIAQLICERIFECQIKQVNNLNETNREVRGF